MVQANGIWHSTKWFQILLICTPKIGEVISTLNCAYLFVGGDNLSIPSGALHQTKQNKQKENTTDSNGALVLPYPKEDQALFQTRCLLPTRYLL